MNVKSISVALDKPRNAYLRVSYFGWIFRKRKFAWRDL